MLSDEKIKIVVEDYIGVNGGYLGDFSYKTHKSFYRDFCNIEGVDPNVIEGTTRQRFITILKSRSPDDQIKILNGILNKYKMESFPIEVREFKNKTKEKILLFIEELKNITFELDKIKVGDILLGEYEIVHIPHQKGGFGKVFFAIQKKDNSKVVLKFCAHAEVDIVNRFKREVRLLKDYSNSGKVIEVIEEYFNCSPPFFVMEFADGGDLTNSLEIISVDQKIQEATFLRMVECVYELHRNGHFHRDIKPENFLIKNGEIKISDFGLAQDPESQTRFTTTRQGFGTEGYYPPQFLQGGFKSPHYSDDIYSLGKSFYYLATGKNPLFVIPENVKGPLYRVIEKCIQNDRAKRYQTCDELSKSLVDAYDILLQRKNPSTVFDRHRKEIIEKYSSSSTFLPPKIIIEFLESLFEKELSEKKKFIDEVPNGFLFHLVTESEFGPFLSNYFEIYKEISEFAFTQSYFPFSYAEGVASDFSIVNNSKIENSLKAKMLFIALEMSIKFSRGKALDICFEELKNINDDDLAFLTKGILLELGTSWCYDRLNPSDFKHFSIMDTIQFLKQELKKM